jgi:hypothetical protein
MTADGLQGYAEMVKGTKIRSLCAFRFNTESIFVKHVLTKFNRKEMSAAVLRQNSSKLPQAIRCFLLLTC